MQNVIIFVAMVIASIIIGCGSSFDSESNLTPSDKCIENSYLQCNCDAGIGTQKCINGVFGDCVCNDIVKDTGTDVNSDVFDSGATDSNTIDSNVIDSTIADSNTSDSNTDSSNKCIPGSVMCSEKSRLSCNTEGVWVVDSTCEFICSIKGVHTECSGECNPGVKRCNNSDINNIRVEYCSTDGFWQTNETCVMSCDNSDTKCIGKSCCYGNDTSCYCKKQVSCDASSGQSVESSCDKLISNIDKACCMVIPGIVAGENECKCFFGYTNCQEKIDYENSKDKSDPTFVCKSRNCHQEKTAILTHIEIME